MRELLWKFFPPIEVTSFKKHVYDFINLYFENQFFHPEIRINQELSDFADKNALRIVEKIRLEHVKVEHFAIKCVISICSKKLKSGEFHDRSDRLKVGGISLLKLVEIGYDELVKKSYMPKEDAEQALAQLKQVILV